MRRVPASPAGVVAHTVLGDALQRPVRGFDAQGDPRPVCFNTDRRIHHAEAVAQTRIVDLQREAGVDHGTIVILEECRHSVDVFFLGLVILIPERVAQPAGTEDGKEEVVQAGARQGDTGLDQLDLMVNGVRRLRRERTADHRAFRFQRASAKLQPGTGVLPTRS